MSSQQNRGGEKENVMTIDDEEVLRNEDRISVRPLYAVLQSIWLRFHLPTRKHRHFLHRQIEVRERRQPEKGL